MIRVPSSADDPKADTHRYDGKAVVAKVDVDEQQMLAIQYGVMSVPTVLFLKNGEEVGRLVGVQPAETYAQTLDKLL